MQKSPVSIVIITKNEASRIQRCLDSVLWADEIIVVDDCSTDGTVALVKKYTDRVVERRMENEGRHRNYAYTLPRNEWVLSLDADEVVTVELRQEIAALLEAKPTAMGYTIPRRNHIGAYWVRYGGMYPSAQVRLFRKGAFLFDEEAEVHPPVSFYAKGEWGKLKGDILHYTYRDFTDAIAKLDRQTDLEARKWFREKRKMGVFFTIRKTIDRFWRAYFSKQGYRDGVIGLFLAVNSGMYQFLTFAKYWELKQKDAEQKSSANA